MGLHPGRDNPPRPPSSLRSGPGTVVLRTSLLSSRGSFSACLRGPEPGGLGGNSPGGGGGGGGESPYEGALGQHNLQVMRVALSFRISYDVKYSSASMKEGILGPERIPCASLLARGSGGFLQEICHKRVLLEHRFPWRLCSFVEI
jgi:hypothetical protein